MTIAVHISSTDTGNGVNDNFNQHLFTMLALHYPAHNFIFIYDGPSGQQAFSKNITTLFIGPQIKNKFQRNYWYNFKIPPLLKKHKTDLFIGTGLSCCLRTNTPQLMIIPDVSFLKNKNLFSGPGGKFLSNYFTRCLKKAMTVIIPGDYFRPQLISYFPAAKNKIRVAKNTFYTTLPKLVHDQVEEIKNEYSAGKEYFVSFITKSSSVYTKTLLKSFSLFKKRQRSNMLLMLIIVDLKAEENLADLSLYKYRDEVKMLLQPHPEITQPIIAASYAAIYLPGLEVLEPYAMKPLEAHVPLISIDNPFCKSLYHDAALYSDANEKNIADNMMLIFKDEYIRKVIIENGRKLSNTYAESTVAGKLWQILESTAKQTT